MFRLVIAFGLAMLLCTGRALCTDSWQSEGRAVQLSASKIELFSVRSDWTSDYDVINRMQGPVYFEDCLAFINESNVSTTHIQFLFAAVDGDGLIRRSPIPLDIRYTAKPGVKYEGRANCRSHGYANGDRGLRLVAWINHVDFADGTSWSAPTGSALSAVIESALTPSE